MRSSLCCVPSVLRASRDAVLAPFEPRDATRWILRPRALVKEKAALAPAAQPRARPVESRRQVCYKKGKGNAAVQLIKRILPIVASLLYVVSPLDAMPDFLPGVGWLDDLLVIGFLLWYMSRQSQGRSPWDVFRERMQGRGTR